MQYRTERRQHRDGDYDIEIFCEFPEYGDYTEYVGRVSHYSDGVKFSQNDMQGLTVEDMEFALQVMRDEIENRKK